MTDADKFQELDRLFQAVCDLPADQQAQHLVELAPGNESLQSEVIELLKAERSSAGVTPESFHESIASILTGSIETPEAIGNYRIIRTLGQGGMGIVYEAQQQSPQRTVALKLLRPGLATQELIRRFEFEAEALGRLQHPNIAHIYEAGLVETPAGPRPFFAMEIVNRSTAGHESRAPRFGRSSSSSPTSATRSSMRTRRASYTAISSLPISSSRRTTNQRCLISASLAPRMPPRTCSKRSPPNRVNSWAPWPT